MLVGKSRSRTDFWCSPTIPIIRLSPPARPSVSTWASDNSTWHSPGYYMMGSRKSQNNLTHTGCFLFGMPRSLKWNSWNMFIIQCQFPEWWVHRNTLHILRTAQSLCSVHQWRPHPVTNGFWTNCPRDVRWPQKFSASIGNPRRTDFHGGSVNHMGSWPQNTWFFRCLFPSHRIIDPTFYIAGELFLLMFAFLSVTHATLSRNWFYKVAVKEPFSQRNITTVHKMKSCVHVWHGHWTWTFWPYVILHGR